jgi:hypothetical protein
MTSRRTSSYRAAGPRCGLGTARRPTWSPVTGDEPLTARHLISNSPQVPAYYRQLAAAT